MRKNRWSRKNRFRVIAANVSQSYARKSMAQDPSPAATKEDIGLLMERMGKNDQSIHDVKIEMRELREELKQEFQQGMYELEGRMTRYFGVLVEDLKHDFRGAHKDRIENHEDRIKRLEGHTEVLAI